MSLRDDVSKWILRDDVSKLILRLGPFLNGYNAQLFHTLPT